LKITSDREAEIGRCLRGTTETTIPEQAGKMDPPKNKTPHSIGTNIINSSTNESTEASKPAKNPEGENKK